MHYVDEAVPKWDGEWVLWEHLPVESSHATGRVVQVSSGAWGYSTRELLRVLIRKRASHPAGKAPKKHVSAIIYRVLHDVLWRHGLQIACFYNKQQGMCGADQADCNAGITISPMVDKNLV